jgi:hypothetical protein
LPWPGVPLITKSQGAFEVAVQEQSGKLAVTFTVPLPRSGSGDLLDIDRESAGRSGLRYGDDLAGDGNQGASALRFADNGFADAVRLTLPLPAPLVPLVTLIQLTVENANHGQLFIVAITLMLSDPPLLGIVSCAGTAEYPQPTVDAEGINSRTLLPVPIDSTK